MLDSVLGRPGSWGARALDAVALRLVRQGVAPNSLSYTALTLGLTAGWLFLLGHRKPALLMLVLSGLIDAIDRLVEVAVLLGIAFPKKQWHLPALVLACTWYVNLCVFLAVGAASETRREKVIHYPPGLVERTEGLLFALIVVFAPHRAPLALYVYAALELATAVQRFLYGRRALRK